MPNLRDEYLSKTDAERPMANDLNDDARWRIALAKDRRYDGAFVMGVHSTGIYCRPSCPARAPKRENVGFYASAEHAEAAGLRPCRRCAPNEVSRDERAVYAALKTLREAEEPVALARLAEASGYSPSHFQRIFSRAIGLSPAAYHRAVRRERAAAALKDECDVTDAIYAAGYSAPSQFYQDMKERSGMTPKARARGGEGMTIRWAVVDTSLGEMLVAATEHGVCRLSFGENERALRRRFPKARLIPGDRDFADLLQRVAGAVEEPGTGRDIPLDVRGTAFQEACWQALREIPPGETRFYADIAAAAGNAKAVRAAGSANARNDIAVLIPCHRVIRSDGALGGYAYGADIKRELLRRESAPGDFGDRGE